jgi:hypothetical protein
MSVFEQARADGEQANNDGHYANSNPHKPRSVLFAYWLQGWQSGQALREEWEQDNHVRAVMYADE